jgi:uncharacterized LabA/DUF88 family protein
MEKQRVIVYVDGFNFYFGLRNKKWRKYYWLDFVKFFDIQLKPYQELVEVNYFSAIPLNQDKADRQDLLFSANLLNPKFKLHFGKYFKKKIWCPNCNDFIHSFEEKETDVRIATRMIYDVVKNNCDVSILVSADSDLIPPIEFIREFKPIHKIIIYFPPLRSSFSLQNICNSFKKLDGAQKIFDASLLPESVALVSGYEVKCPAKWKS